MKKIVFLDAGHGGIDPKTKAYLSLVGGKQYTHPKGNFHNGPTFYEGVFNRQVAKLTKEKLEKFGIEVQEIYHPYLDISLSRRARFANAVYQFKKQKDKDLLACLISLHANAGGGSGYEIYKAPVKSTSSILATNLHKETKTAFGNAIAYRKTWTNKLYKEAGFQILMKTAMPAVLIEHLFFDDYNDALKLVEPYFIDLFAEANAIGTVQYFNEIAYAK